MRMQFAQSLCLAVVRSAIARVVDAHAANFHDVAEVAHQSTGELLAEGVRVRDVHAVSRRDRPHADSVECERVARLRANNSLRRHTAQLVDNRSRRDHREPRVGEQRVRAWPVKVVHVLVRNEHEVRFGKRRLSALLAPETAARPSNSETDRRRRRCRGPYRAGESRLVPATTARHPTRRLSVPRSAARAARMSSVWVRLCMATRRKLSSSEPSSPVLMYPRWLSAVSSASASTSSMAVCADSSSGRS